MNTAVRRRYGTRVARRSHLEIREIATGVRRVLQLTGARIDMLDLLENRLDARGIRYHYAPDEELEGDIARSFPAKGLIIIGLTAHRSLSEGEPDHALLVPHELGHIVLGHEASFARSSVALQHDLVEDSEWQAEVFAIEFAMPHDMVCRLCRSVGDIVSLFGVTHHDAEARVLMLRVERAISW